LDVVELLIEHGAWVDAITKSKTTPLHFAAYTGNIETAELLIEKGASMNAFKSDNKTPLHFVIDNQTWKQPHY
jgi:ankyrin repeat protein